MLFHFRFFHPADVAAETFLLVCFLCGIRYSNLVRTVLDFDNFYVTAIGGKPFRLISEN